MEWNRQAEKVFGWSSAQVHGKRMAEQLVSEGDRERYAEMRGRRSRGSQVIEAVTDCRTRDGEDIRCRRWWSLALREEGALVGLMTLALDITEQYHTEQQLELYRNDLEQRVEQRTAELATAQGAGADHRQEPDPGPSCSTPAIA